MKNALSNKLLSSLQHPLKKRALLFLCLAVLFFIFAPLVAMCFYAHPVYDDFSHTLNTARIWAQTGNLPEVVRSAWEHTLHMYQTWQGTFVAMFFSVFQPMVFSPDLFWLTPLSTLLCLGLSAWYFVHQLIRRLLDGDGLTAFGVYTILMGFMLAYMPGMREVIYWQSGTPYTMSIIALFILMGLLISLHLDSRHTWWKVILAVLMGIVIGGCPYPLALGCTVGSALAAFWCFRNRSSARAASLLSFFSMLCALITVVLAPGNGVRQARVGESLSPVSTIIHSLEECLQLTGDWFSPQLIAVVILLALLTWNTLKSSRLRFSNPGWFSFFTFGVLAASFAPSLFAQGVENYQNDRILACLYMLYVVLVILNSLYWLGWLSKRFSLSMNEIRAWHALFCAGLLAWGLLSISIFATPCVASWVELVTGKASQYHTEMNAREAAIRDSLSAQKASEVIVELSHQPVVLPLDKLIYQTETRLPWEMHEYYRLAGLVKTYGAGQIPPEEWNALQQELAKGTMYP